MVPKHSIRLAIALEQHLGREGVRDGVEVGVWEGDNAAYLLQKFPRLHLLLVDPYISYSLIDKTEPSGSMFKRQQCMDEAKKIAIEKAGVTHFPNDGGRTGRATFVDMESTVAARHPISNFPFDYVFIDAHHSYESVRADIEAWWPRVRIGGLLLGHDYKRSATRGVKQAVDEFIAADAYARNGDNGFRNYRVLQQMSRSIWGINKWD